jgi:hypothetical protein
MRSVEGSVEEKKAAKPPLRGEIVKGWHWVVFVWGMLKRLGGPMAILRTFWTIISLLVKRTLAQWGLGK